MEADLHYQSRLWYRSIKVSFGDCYDGGVQLVYGKMKGRRGRLEDLIASHRFPDTSTPHVAHRDCD